MKKFILSLSIIICISAVSFSQKKEKEIKYKKTFYKNQTIENADLKITIDDAVATVTGMKFKISIVNKSSDYIVFKPSECEFKIKGNAVKPIEKWIVIPPNDKDWKTIDIKGSQYILPENFDFVMDGFYKVSIDSKGNTTADFKLPPSSNEFKSGGFSASLDGLKKETIATEAKFKVTYSGDKIGVIDQNKVAIKMPDGKEFANYFSDKKPIFFVNGTSDDFKVAFKGIPLESGDMQKVEMNILWRDSFKEITPVKIPSLNLTILFDKEFSYAKGR